MEKIHQLNKGLLIILGLCEPIAQSIVEYIDELEKEKVVWTTRYAAMLLNHENELIQMQARLLTMLGEAQARIKELETQKPE